MNMSVSVKGKEVHGSSPPLLKFGIDLSHAEEKVK